jgi:ADP-ribose pyrophosphatase YjhB (NUDIX family)
MAKIERIRTGVKAFIVHKGKVLVVRERVRRNNQVTVIHDLPGGGIELGETIKEALSREVMEEVGLTIEIGNPVGCWDFLVKNPEESILIVCLAYQCSLNKEPVIDISKNPAKEDIFETVWMDKDEILNSPEMFDNPDILKSLQNVRF